MESKKQNYTKAEVQQLLEDHGKFVQQLERTSTTVRESFAYFQGKREMLLSAVPIAWFFGALVGFVLGRWVF